MGWRSECTMYPAVLCISWLASERLPHANLHSRQIGAGGIDGRDAKIDRHDFDADIVDIMCLVKYHDALSLHGSRHKRRNLRIEQILEGRKGQERGEGGRSM
eukprot:scaffold83281_cov36-Tisochrysis_lutea.AAC.6